MSVAAVHPEPWTIDALYALPEDGMRHELLDGTLLVTPPPSVPHQLAARRLVAARGQEPRTLCVPFPAHDHRVGPHGAMSKALTRVDDPAATPLDDDRPDGPSSVAG